MPWPGRGAIGSRIARRSRRGGTRRPRSLRQRELLEQHREKLLEHLDRLHLGDAGYGAAVGEAVDLGAAAVAAAREVVHDIVLALLGVVAADPHVAAGAGGGGEQLVGDRLDQGREHRLGDALAHLRRAARHRPWIFRKQERPLGLANMQRIEDAGIHRHVGEDVLDGEVDRGPRGRDDAVHRPAARRARFRQVEGEVLPCLRDAQADAERCVVDTVGIDEGLALVDAVGNLRDSARICLAARDLSSEIASSTTPSP